MKTCGPTTGAILGTALGDSLGLPSEGMSRRRIAKRWKGSLEQRFFLGKGMLSDDTEHTIFVAQAILECGGDVRVFERKLAWKLRWWFAGLPAGIGLATAKAIIKLWLGFPHGRNGVHSAGNGPVMRAPVIGAFFSNDRDKREAFVTKSTFLTHTDTKALEAAMMAAECAAFAATRKNDRQVILERMQEIAVSPEWKQPLDQIAKGLDGEMSVEDLMMIAGFGKGVSGYAVHTMTAVLFIWLKHRGDFERIVGEAIACGGDTDSVAAIAGGIAGAEAGDFRASWLDGLKDFPNTVGYMKRLGKEMDSFEGGGAVKILPAARLAILPRNLVLLLLVLGHGFRRLLPPY